MKKRRGPVTAEELMAELEANPEWVAQRAEQDRRLQERATAFRQAAAPLLDELERAGISTDDAARL